MTTLALVERIPRTPAVEINGRHAIVNATAFAALRTRAFDLGQGRWLVPFAGGSTTDGASAAVRVPTFDELARNPLPLGLLLELRRQAAHLVVDLDAAISRASMPLEPPGAPPPPDRAVRIEEAARLLGMTTDHLYRHKQRYGGYRDSDGHIKFPLSAIARHIAQGDGGQPPPA
jgi:hypothetical protein